jgi:N-acetylglucosaminyldiphosphoundecaprenol N-acetyl-beta-D-mannosaminyltransferase
VNVLGVGVSVLNLPAALAALADAVVRRNKGYVCVTGVHGVSEAQADAALRHIHNRAFLVTPDGMPMVWLGRLAGHRGMDRVYGPDLMTLVMRESAARGWRHFLYGGTNGTAEKLCAVLTKKFPGLDIAGTYEPPFRPLNEAEQATLAGQVAAVRPDFFWVGLSTPKQERFMAEYLPRLDTTVMLGVGAAFDMLAGNVAQAPRWMQRSGLEWFYRLCREPRRLGPRYLVNNPLFVLRVAAQLSGLRRYTLER